MMTKYSGMNLMRHEAALTAAECATVNLQQAIDDAQAILTIAKAEYAKEYQYAYFKAFELLKDRENK